MLHHLASGYAAAGHDVVMVVPGARDRTTSTRYGRLVEIAAPLLPRTGGYRMITRWSAVEDVLAAVAPDRIEVSDRFTLARMGAWASRQRIPSVAFSHERLDAILRHYLGRLTPSRRLADRWNRWLAASFDMVVCTTSWAAEEFVRIGARNLAHVPLGIDLTTFHPAHADPRLRTRLAQGAEVLVVAAVRLSPEKRPEQLLPMVEHLTRTGTKVRLVICGDGPMRAGLELKSTDLPVTMMGFVADRDELARIMASADVAVAPGPYETFGLSALEALASGTPVVATASGALPELVRRGCGRIVQPEPAALASGVLDVIAAGDTARRAARRRAEDFSWAATVSGMLAVHDAASGHWVA